MSGRGSQGVGGRGAEAANREAAGRVGDVEYDVEGSMGYRVDGLIM